MGKTYPLGLDISPEEKMKTQVDIAAAHVLLKAILFKYPPQWDWRNVGGKNFLTSIKDQQTCGSCVAFAACGAAEARKKIDAQDASQNPDLSEWFLFQRGNGSCSTGSQFGSILSALVNPGTPDEACCPYLGSSTCANWTDRVTKAASYTVLRTASQAKEWIATKGPVIAGMEVYTDFFDVNSNEIYTHKNGDFAGNHAICLFGFDEVKGCWLLKNSWSSSWGVDGFCRIAYEQCGIGSSFYFYGIDLSSSPVPPGPTPTPSVLGTDDIKVTKTGNMTIKLTRLNVTYPLTVSLYKPIDKDLGTFSKGEIGKVLNVGPVSKGDIVGFKIVTGEGKPRTFYTDGPLNTGKYRYLFTLPYGSGIWHIMGELAGRLDHGELTIQVSIK